MATLDASQRSTLDTIAAAIPALQPRPDLSWPAASVAIGGSPASLDGRDAPGANGNVAWLSALNVASKISSLQIFNGPLTDVPHLFSQCRAISDTELSFVLDLRPRAYGAYELRRDDGTYPGPDELGRAAFTYSGNRMEFDTKFGTPAVAAFLESTLASLQGATPNSIPPTPLDVLTRGPLCMDVTVPLSDANVAAVVVARETAANYWLGWALDAEHAHRPGAPVNSQYVYDTKYKQNAYGALLPVYSTLFGAEDGASVTAADLGPLDEGYVGGGS
jgi:hypothetical protein